MGFMPEFSEEDTKIMKGTNAAASGAAGEARSSLADRLLPPEERVTRGFSKDQVLIAGTSGNAADVIMGNSTMMCAFNGANILADLDAGFRAAKEA